jgi:uncharacterized protein Yka (UPF0111/DUF47 family)
MDNSLKLLMTEEDLHNLKKIAIEIENYNKLLSTLRDSFANEARRAINYNHKVDTAIREGDKIVSAIKNMLTERV